MTTMTFHSDDPDRQSNDVQHPNSRPAFVLERLMRLPAYWNVNDPMHHRAVSDVKAHYENLYGTANMPSGGNNSGFPTMSFNAETGERVTRDMPGAPMVGSGEGSPDEYNKVD